MSRRAHAGGKREAPERLAIGLSHQSTTALRSTNYCNIVFPRAEGSGSKGRFWIQGVPFSPAAYKFCPTVSSPAPSILGLSASRFPLLPEASSRVRSLSSLRSSEVVTMTHILGHTLFFFSVPVVLSILVRAGFAVRCSFMSWWTRCFLCFLLERRVSDDGSVSSLTWAGLHAATRGNATGRGRRRGGPRPRGATTGSPRSSGGSGTPRRCRRRLPGRRRRPREAPAPRAARTPARSSRGLYSLVRRICSCWKICICLDLECNAISWALSRAVLKQRFTVKFVAKI